MKRAVITLAIAWLLACSSTFGQSRKPTGFKNIPFGTPKQVVKELLVAEYDMERKFPVPGAPLGSDEGVELHTIANGFILSNYELGSRTYSVRLFFNINNRFCGFLFKGQVYSKREARDDLIEDLAFLSEVFQRKYGVPGNKLVVRVDDVVYSEETNICIRNDEEHCVMTGVVTNKSGRKLRRTKYVPVAGVCDKMFKSEKPGQASVKVDQEEVEEQLEYYLAATRSTAVMQAIQAF
ncbi:MAG: hypothetical protein GF418_05280 [Chitinivibrionales bacterium]|nr:hypothetical protein [Chitinivibrionales bacterium]MBD3395023.1 hypothetical protein [Chitinivibrionales bacterium]